MAAPTARRRRAKFGALTILLLAAVTVSVVIVNMLGSRFAMRVDVTATGEHQLAPRTLRLLSRIDANTNEGEYEIVLAGDLRGLDGRAVDRVRDVLDQLDRASDRLRVTVIDTGSSSGLNAFDGLLQRLAERDAEAISGQKETLTKAADQLESLAAGVESAAQTLAAIEQALPPSLASAQANRQYFQNAAAVMRIHAKNARDAVSSARATLAGTMGSAPVPDTEKARDTLRPPLREISREMGVLATDLRTLADARALGSEGDAAAARLSLQAKQHRDAAAILGESLDRMERSDLVRVARVLEATEAAIVVGPAGRGLTAVSFPTLFPASAVIDASGGAQTDLRRTAEELFATSLGSLSDPARPILVVMHGEPGKGLDQSKQFENLFSRLGLRGIDVLEWATAEEADPPSTAEIDPSRKRPVVYAVLGPNSAAGAPATGGPTGPERAAKLGAAINKLAEQGAPLLLSIAPSVLPTYGETDPTTAVLSEFGLKADSGRPLVRERFISAGRLVDPDHSVRGPEGEHPISGAIHGLPTLLPWAIPLTRTPDAAARVWPLLEIDDTTAWGESQWLGYWQACWQVPVAQRPLIPNTPTKETSRDNVAGPWLVAAAAERSDPALDRPHRLVVVGSNTWFTDGVTRAQGVVDGRIVSAAPGNLELLEAAIYWLAGQGDLIGQTATARAVPLIAPLSEGQLSALRWLVIGGMPALVLALGVLWRALRG